MSKDQWTVTGLILLLMLLEVGRSKTVLSPTGSTNPAKYTKVQSPTPAGVCPKGFTKFFDQFGIAKCGQ